MLPHFFIDLFSLHKTKFVHWNVANVQKQCLLKILTRYYWAWLIPLVLVRIHQFQDKYVFPKAKYQLHFCDKFQCRPIHEGLPSFT